MVASNQTFLTSTEFRIPEVLAKLGSLVHRAITITKISRHGVAQVKAKAFCGTLWTGPRK